MFILPLYSYHQPSRLKINDNSLRKRKRKGSHASEHQSPKSASTRDSCRAPSPDSSPSQPSTLSAVLTPDDLYQFAVAGQSVEDGLQDHPFPHGDSKYKDRPSKFDYDLRRQLRAGHGSSGKAHSSSNNPSLHQKHLAVMTTILHRSLLEEDFVRAGRALSMILRDEAEGKAIDVRAGGRWGVGAEILIRQDVQRQRTSWDQSSSSFPEHGRSPARPRAWFTRKGFEDAMKYYERLIVQYPFYIQNPGSVSALDFYPAMFGLWIYVVHKEAKLKSLDSRPAETGPMGENKLQDEPASPTTMAASEHQNRTQEHTKAREIADRMDTVMSAPPYREDAELVELRRMVGLWIRDLEGAMAALADDKATSMPNEQDISP